jgi:hypothetical protein
MLTPNKTVVYTAKTTGVAPDGGPPVQCSGAYTKSLRSRRWAGQPFSAVGSCSSPEPTSTRTQFRTQ